LGPRRLTRLIQDRSGFKTILSPLPLVALEYLRSFLLTGFLGELELFPISQSPFYPDGRYHRGLCLSFVIVLVNATLVRPSIHGQKRPSLLKKSSSQASRFLASHLRVFKDGMIDRQRIEQPP